MKNQIINATTKKVIYEFESDSLRMEENVEMSIAIDGKKRLSGTLKKIEVEDSVAKYYLHVTWGEYGTIPPYKNIYRGE